MTDKNLKISLKAARINANMTQREVAEKIDVSLSTIRNWENYKTYPTMLEVEKICKVYGLNYDNIIFLP